MLLRIGWIVAVAIAFTGNASGQEASPSKVPSPSIEAPVAHDEKSTPVAPAQDDVHPEVKSEADVSKDSIKKEEQSIWQYFSAGILTNVFFDGPVEDAEIRGGKVRVLAKRDMQVAVGLQAFYPLLKLPYVRSDDGKTWYPYSEHGVGPYAGATLASGDLLDSFALGIAYSHRRKEGGLRIGVGVVLDPNAKYLAADFRENQDAPAGAEGVHFQTRPTLGFQVMMSFTPGL